MSAGIQLSRLPAHEQEINASGERMIRLYRFLRDHGPRHRDHVMHYCGFRSPKLQPVVAYVEFANAVLRLDRILRRYGRCVEGGVNTAEVYKLGEVGP